MPRDPPGSRGIFIYIIPPAHPLASYHIDQLQSKYDLPGDLLESFMANFQEGEILWQTY
jgi:hypothetical protein